MNKTAIILGATGLTGSFLLKMILHDQSYEKVKVFTRSPLSLTHEKLEEISCDLLNLDEVKDQFQGDVAFCCIGTTAKKTPDKDANRKIDFGIPVKASDLCKENEIPLYIVISAIGANAGSSIFYNKTKGEMEQEVLAKNIKHTYILRPSIIQGPRKELRIGEKMGIIFMKVIQIFLIGPLRKYRGIQAEHIAKAMAKVAKNGFENPIISSDKIEELARTE